MSKLKVPSLQHLARNWRGDPDKVRKTLVGLVRNSPTFTYSPLFGLVRDMLVFEQPYEQIVEGVIRGIKRQDVQDNFLGILPLIRDHFDGIVPTFVQPVARRYYPIKRDLMVPFEPPMIYGVDGQIFFPWFSFWRQNPLEGERLSLFVTVVDEILSQDPDLEGSVFQILDFSSPNPKQPRVLSVLEAQNVPRVSEKEKIEMLSIFAEGYFLAQAELSQAPAQEKEQPSTNDGASAQLMLFGDAGKI
jgi:hypothetical protein